MKMPEGFTSWTPDEVAECMEGVGLPMYRRLWELLETIPPMPVGGDGSNGTIEFPPEPDAYLGSKMGAIWDKLTTDEQAHLTECYSKHEARYR